jgi:N-acetylglucosaminyl-diphospho-decaprenol L-rhamnosyltransferase
VARGRPRCGIVGPMVRNSDGSIYQSGRPFPSITDAVGHAFLGSALPENRFSQRYHLDGWDRTSDREVDWVSGCCMLLPREALEEVGLLDEGFPLYGEELDLATRLRDVGRTSFYSSDVEIVHESGVSTGRTRRSLVMHSSSIYRYYARHRAPGWRRATLPLAWLTLRARAELEWVLGSMRER